jgi:uncharacterized protein
VATSAKLNRMTSGSWKRALVTGASSGIGEAIARQLAANGTELVLVARDTERLKRLADSVPVPCQVLTADLDDPIQLLTVEHRLAAQTDPIDLLVNNAGFGFVGNFNDLDLDRECSVVNVNITAVMRLAHAAGSAMKQRRSGGILNVSSLAGFIPAPNSATYAATKAFVTSFSQALHEELKSHGVHVSALCPGYTRTEFQQRANATEESNRVPSFLWQSADEVARAGLVGIAKNQAVVVPGKQNKALSGLTSALPRGVTRRIVSAGTSK